MIYTFIPSLHYTGKTYSIFGGDSYQDRGLIPRSLSLLFKSLKERKKNEPKFVFKIRISFCEVYKEVVYDLLDPSKPRNNIDNYPVVEILEDKGKRTTGGS